MYKIACLGFDSSTIVTLALFQHYPWVVLLVADDSVQNVLSLVF